MPLPTRILAPVDFSPRCRGASRYAECLARQFHCELALLHAVPPKAGPLVSPDAMAYVTAGEWSEDRLGERKARLAAFMQGSQDGFTVTQETVEADPAPAIISYAEAWAADLIVMATHGYGPVRRLLLGSVTAKVLHGVHCPVLTGPHLETAPPWNEIQFRRILCAIDLLAGSVAVLEWAEEFARSRGAELVVIHVLPDTLIEVGGVYFDPDWRMDTAKTAREQIESLPGMARLKADVQIEFGDATKAVAELAGRWQSDLLVIGRGNESRLSSRLGSTAYAILRESPCPVVVV